jgi:hypothetical protein
VVLKLNFSDLHSQWILENMACSSLKQSWVIAQLIEVKAPQLETISIRVSVATKLPLLFGCWEHQASRLGSEQDHSGMLAQATCCFGITVSHLFDS